IFPFTQLVQARAVCKANKMYKLNIGIVNSFSSAPVVALRSFFIKRCIKNVKLVHTLKGFSMFSFGSLKYSRFLNYADAVVVPTPFLRQKVIENGCSAEKINVIDTLIDMRKFKPMKVKKTNTIMYYGHLKKLKGVEYLIRAAQYIDDVNIVISWSGIGDLSYHKNLIKELGLQDRTSILMPGMPYPKFVRMINESNALVFPYTTVKSTEMPPSCVLESMACGKPVIVSDFPEFRQVFKDEVLFAKPKDARDLANKINLVIGDKKLAAKLSKNALKKAKQYDAKNVATKYLKLYKELRV
ncbi:glycosyltransferase, partial [Candidatus Woesearchaeota archaeon]|nr:glycosyltransferase [Candidatus Woesearchaeota archaeon]